MPHELTFVLINLNLDGFTDGRKCAAMTINLAFAGLHRKDPPLLGKSSPIRPVGRKKMLGNGVELADFQQDYLRGAQLSSTGNVQKHFWMPKPSRVFYKLYLPTL